MAEEAAITPFDLERHYTHLWEDSLRMFRAGAFELDPLIDDKSDNRYGITLLFRLGQEVGGKVQQFLRELRETEPDQYYYPETDTHVTVMSVISCHTGFSLDSIRVEEYVQLIRQTVQNCHSFEIDFKGVTASPSCLLIQGFPVADQLNKLRNQLRENFRKTSLQQTIDVRYVLKTAHCTVVRFKAPLRSPNKFLQQVQAYRYHDFGRTTVGELELVYNDWYQRHNLVRLLESFELKKCIADV